MTLETPQRARLVTAAILLLVFGTGVLLGLVLERSLMAEPSDTAATAAETEEAEEPRRYMFERVDLTPEQRGVIDSLVVEHRASMSALRRQFSEEYDPQYRAIVESTRASIMEVMTPEQAAMYDSITAARDRERAAEDSAAATG